MDLNLARWGYIDNAPDTFRQGSAYPAPQLAHSSGWATNCTLGAWGDRLPPLMVVHGRDGEAKQAVQ